MKLALITLLIRQTVIPGLAQEPVKRALIAHIRDEGLNRSQAHSEAVKPIFDARLEPFKELAARRHIAQGIGNTDHLSFTRAGLSGFNPMQEYVDYDECAIQCAIVLASFAYHAAMQAEKIPGAK